MNYPHDTTYPWPFPRLPVRIRAVESNVATKVIPAYLDTGADATLVPLTYLKMLQAEAVQTVRLRSHWGEARSVTLYLIDLEIAGQLLPEIEVVADKFTDEVLLGRNVLDKLILLLDGPKSHSRVLERREVERLKPL